MKESKGVIYIATGEKFRDEACRSAASLKAHMPDLAVTIITNAPLEAPAIDRVIIVSKPYYGYSDKTEYMYLSPYEHTLFLDTDTYICADCMEMFSLLERFDIATAHAPFRMSSIDAGCPKDYHLAGVPDCFPEMNTGVILFKKNYRVEQFFTNWLALQKEALTREPNPLDQVTFRQALYDSELRIATLTPEYNCRFIVPIFVSRTVKILHGQHPVLSSVAKEINSETVGRVYVEWDTYGQCKLSHQWHDMKREIKNLRARIQDIQQSKFWKFYTLWGQTKQFWLSYKYR